MIVNIVPDGQVQGAFYLTQLNGLGPKLVFVFPGPNWENLPMAIASTISGEVTET